MIISGALPFLRSKQISEEIVHVALENCLQNSDSNGYTVYLSLRRSLVELLSLQINCLKTLTLATMNSMQEIVQKNPKETLKNAVAHPNQNTSSG